MSQAENTGETSAATVQASDEEKIKNRRRQLRARITRSINRLTENIVGGDQNEGRIKRILEEIKSDYTTACQVHGELYNFAEDSQFSRLDQWETDLSNDVYDIEDKVDDYLASLLSNAQPTQGVRTRATTARNATTPPAEDSETQPLHTTQTSPPHETERASDDLQSEHSVPPQSVHSIPENSNSSQAPETFDSWIDHLVEYTETVLPTAIRDMSISEALYKLEASKDIPPISLNKFDGNPLEYVDFIERFKIHIHNKPHLTDDIRIVQLRMHLTGDAERAISGLGSSGVMYATALKILKDQFGQPSSIARACLKRLTCGKKIGAKDRQSLRDFSLDIENSISVFQRIGFYSDVNSTESLRQIISRLPDYMISTWKSVAADIRTSGKIPTVKEVSNFIRKRVRAEYDPDFGDIETGSQRQESKGKWEKKKGVYSTQTKREIKCYVCEEPHRVTECPTFKDSSVSERQNYAREHRLCYSCLTKGHMSAECRSKKKCDKHGCSRTHHYLLHTDPPPASGVSSVLDRDGIMPVIRVRFRSQNGKTREGNVLIDSGAGTTVIRREFAKALGLQGKAERFDISVVGGNTIEQHSSRRVKFWISPLDGGDEHCIEAHDIEKTIVSVPPLNRQWLKTHSHLSDLEFQHKAGPVDLILGVQYSHLHVDEDVRQGLPFEPVAKKTPLGWYVLGSDSTKAISSVCSIGFVQKVDLEKFYACETLGIQAPECNCPVKAMSPDDRRTLQLFEGSCRLEGERYVIGLPWKSDPAQLPDNYPMAEKRLISLERSLSKDDSRATLYTEAIHEYVDNGWAKQLTTKELDSDIQPVFYLPHHGVYRPERKSTPLRVVFDPACVYKGVSLNSLLHKGPCLIGNLLGVLLRFREQEIAFMGDISKMYLQICLPEADTHVHRFLWRDLETSKQPTIYRLLRVTFGDKPSPDMASFVMLRIAEEAKSEYPEAAKILQTDRYVDDLIHSCATKADASQKMSDVDKIIATGSFKIKHWYMSRGEEPNATSTEESETQNRDFPEKSVSETELQIDGEDTTKALGVTWNPKRDVIKFAVKPSVSEHLTKRIILSRISGIYDPLGLASAVTIRARIALQDIWRSKEFDWDDELPRATCELWENLFREIQALRTVEFPRSLKPPEVSGPSELHVFADASASAYGSVAYMVWPTPTGNTVRLVSAKARVAPLQQTTVPRLELMAALVASRLANTITEEFKEKPNKVYLWTDSQVVLHWLQSDSIALKAFVGVRVSEIQATWDVGQWRYVPSQLNPADDLSRGLEVRDLGNRWMNGPVFLKRPQETWPVLETKIPVNDCEVKKVKPISAVTTTSPVVDPSDFSDWQRMVRVTAFCIRFIHNLRSRIQKSGECLSGALTPTEVGKAETYWFITAQKDLGDWEHTCRDLSPFLRNGIVRVGGRLRRSPLTYEQNHPILLPASHVISTLIMRDVHHRMGHTGPERTLSESRRTVWIVRGRNLARSVVKECVICRKLRQPAHTTLMADLPHERLKVLSPPFTSTGVDLYGPFLLKLTRNKSVKAWGALFTCATTRAIHLEIVEGLSTAAFLHALRRFASRHGWPTTIISDNGTSFVGAEKELRKLYEEGKKEFEDFASAHKVVWKFNTPLSPHQGGMFESMIKQVKRAIRVAIGQQLLSWNEMSTVFAEVECLVNSRPIGHMPNSPDDVQPLTPNHFLIGRATATVPQGPFEETKNLHKRFEFVQTLVHHFWKRFIREYIPTLMRRSKWQTKNRQLSIGDIVLLTDPDVARGKWNLARVIQVYPGDDGIIRNVKVKTRVGEYKRSVQRCCPILESDL